jgi:xanthine dehydrogenase accessory factor
MVVSEEGYHGTIGGGALEWQAMAEAQAMLGKPRTWRVVRKVLGPDLGQCCGGRVDLLVESFATADIASVADLARQEEAGPFEICGRAVAGLSEQFGEARREIHLWGAGHVGRALALALAPLPFHLVWSDPRDGAFPSHVPGNCTLRRSQTLPGHIAEGSFLIAMTHSHGLDLALVDLALRNPAFSRVGVIGSETKRARFLNRLRDLGHDEASRQRLVCPIGMKEIGSRLPAAIAIGVVAQLLQWDQLLRSGEMPAARPLEVAKV